MGAPSPSWGKFQGEEGPTLGSQGRMGKERVTKWVVLRSHPGPCLERAEGI